MLFRSDVHSFYYKKQGVTEAFDQPYKLTWQKNKKDYSAFAKMDDGTYIEVLFDLERTNPRGDIYSVQFWRNRSIAITGEGDSQRVFATVLEAIRQFLSKPNVNVMAMVFTAEKSEDSGDENSGDSKDKRINLYKRMAQRFAPMIGYNLTVRDYPNQIAFVLRRKKLDISEASGYIPSESEKNDPRFCRALSVDVGPDAIKKNAKAFGFKVSRAGIPPLLRK